MEREVRVRECCGEYTSSKAVVSAAGDEVCGGVHDMCVAKRSRKHSTG